MAMKCALCGQNAQYRDRHTEQYVCLEHARLEVIAMARHGNNASPLTIRGAIPADGDVIEKLMLYFWDETGVECFDHEYDVLHLPAFLVCDGDEVMGLLAYAKEGDALNLVVLNVLPQAQGRGGGQALLQAALAEAQARSLARLVVATTNDDLQALYLYQRFGFQITEVLPGQLVKHHGRQETGFAGIPVRDEIRLERPVTNAGSGDAFKPS
jgi:ribosomal protein S18 acetylase RimI-like enzyme